MELDKGVQRVLMQIIKEGEEAKRAQSFKSPHPDESYLDELNIDEDNESLLDDYDETLNKENIRSNTPLSISTSISKRTPMSMRSPNHYRSPMANMNSANRFSGSFKSTPMSISPLNRGKLLQMQRETIQLKDANEALVDELESERRQANNLRLKLEEMEAKNRAIQMKIESENLENSNKVREEYDNRIKNLEHQLKKARKNAENSDTMKDEILRLKDEVDILHASQTKFKQTEEQFGKMKERIEKMGDLKKILESEQKAHGEAIAKCIDLENKINVLAPLKGQLEVYKNRATDAEVQLVDCQDELRKLKESSHDMIDQNKELHVNSQRQKAEVEALRQQLADDQTTAGPDTYNKVGEGISELNPVVKEELLRLRNENKRLTVFAAKREDDAVHQMEQELDDAQRLSEKFKDQFLSTKNTLEETKGLLEASSSRESRMQNDIQNLQEVNESLKQTIEEERRDAKEAAIEASQLLESTKQQLEESHKDELKRTNNDFEFKLKQILSDHEAKCQQMCQEFEQKEDQHNQTKFDLMANHAAVVANLSTERDEEIKCLQEKHINELRTLDQKNSEARDELITKGKQMISKLKLEADEKIKALTSSLSMVNEEKDTLMKNQKEYEERVAKKISSYKQKLAVAQTEIEEATSQSDDFETKMKKSEKEKACLQDENDRYRRQLNGRMGVDQSQYEALQHEYNLVLEENKSLKSSPNPIGFGPESTMNAFDVNARMGYTMGSQVSASSISQIRDEYEEKIEVLCDEKRQLIMKNSALVGDEKRALNQVWDLEVKVKDLQELNTKLQLQVERYKRNRSETASNISRKRLAENLSPQSCNKHSIKVAKPSFTPLKDMQNVVGPLSPMISPTDSTLPHIDIKSPEFNKSMDTFRKKFINKMNTAKKEREKNNSNLNEIQLDDEWKIH